MFIRVPTEKVTEILPNLQNKNVTEIRTFSNVEDLKVEKFNLPQEIIDDLIDGVLILTTQGDLVYANTCATRVLRNIDSGHANFSDFPQEIKHINHLPKEIKHIYETLIKTRNIFPGQHWCFQTRVFLSSASVFNTQARWIQLEGIDYPCILLVLKDQYQMIKNIVNDEVQKFGLTSREHEIWLRHRANYTYKQISEELSITPNTVKKHMKNIHLKQRNISYSSGFFEDR